ncbi:CvpA family protein [Staphylococcus simulans]|uniref:CvpA family protein n=1 Tax=Staphylococcus simulans TaxID=1286 RepID=UPI001F450723|nr:CvpA family protein [Staphylococcus simulans]
MPMLLNVLIFITFFMIAAMGFRRGFWWSLVHFLCTAASFKTAAALYAPVAKRLELFLPFPKTQAAQTHYFIEYHHIHLRFESIVAFILIFLMSKFILYLIVTAFDKITYVQPLSIMNRSFGVIISFLSSVMIVLLVLYLCSLYPSVLIQQQFAQSVIAQLILFQTPYLSSFVMTL